jgi:hypothetical protein
MTRCKQRRTRVAEIETKAQLERADKMIAAYEWVKAATWQPSPFGHAVKEWLREGFGMRTLCGLNIGTRRDDTPIARCDRCLNVIYAAARRTS